MNANIIHCPLWGQGFKRRDALKGVEASGCFGHDKTWPSLDLNLYICVEWVRPSVLCTVQEHQAGDEGLLDIKTGRKVRLLMEK